MDFYVDLPKVNYFIRKVLLFVFKQKMGTLNNSFCPNMLLFQHYNIKCSEITKISDKNEIHFSNKINLS